jgi:hypothetical protein
VQQNISQIHQWLARLFLAGLLVQFYLAGAPLFGVTSFQPHRMLGGALTMLAISLPVLALVGRLDQRLVRLSFLLLVLVFVQGMLPMLRGSIPWMAAFHSVNALALIGISLRIGRAGRAVVLPAS